MKSFEIRILPWPEKLLRTLFPGDKYDKMNAIISPDFESNLIHVLCDALSERESDIVYAYYRDGVSLRSIADQFDMNIGWCRQVRDKALRRLRHPARSRHLRAGLVNVVMPLQ